MYGKLSHLLHFKQCDARKEEGKSFPYKNIMWYVVMVNKHSLILFIPTFYK